MGDFKKGDFVRVRPGKGTVLLKDEGIYEVLGHSVQGRPILPVTTSNGIRINLDYSAERLTLWRPAAEQPATLKIEAGKFYRTRDGRKVGPVRLKATHGSDGPYRIDGLWNYLENGLVGSISNGDHKDDLIAEWIDEPVGDDYDTWFRAKVQESLDDTSPTIPHAEVMQSIKARIAKASNDNAKPKFKVGDRVRVVKQGFTNGGSGHDAKVGDVFTLKYMNSAKTFWRTDGPDFYEHELEPVMDTAKSHHPPPQSSPSSKTASPSHRQRRTSIHPKSPPTRRLAALLRSTRASSSAYSR